MDRRGRFRVRWPNLTRRKIRAGRDGDLLPVGTGMNQLDERNSAGTLLRSPLHKHPWPRPRCRASAAVVEVEPSHGYRRRIFQYLHMDQQGSVPRSHRRCSRYPRSSTPKRWAFGRQIVAPSRHWSNCPPTPLVFQEQLAHHHGRDEALWGSAQSRVFDFETGRFLSRDPATHRPVERISLGE